MDKKASQPGPEPQRLPVLVAFGRVVRHLRREQGFSQETFAQYCGLDRSYLGGVERGERNITLANMERIICALHLKPSEFFAALDEDFANLAQQGHVIQFQAFAAHVRALRKRGKQSS